jgi:hypothetical protein
MEKINRVLYIIMAVAAALSLILDAIEGHFDIWKLNSLCLLGIIYMHEMRAVKAEKKHEELLNDLRK